MTVLFGFPRLVRAAALASGMSLAAGAAVGCSIFASHEEANLYRRIRTTTDANARMVAMGEYATRYPGGAWIDGIRAERQSNEERIWAANNASADGLAFYLSAYPDGTYVEQARARQAALQTVITSREQSAERQEQLERERAQQTAEQRRQWVTRATQFWMRTLVGVRNLGAPIAQVARQNPEFSRAFGAAPAPQCTPQRCIKHYHAHYAIPVPGGNRIEREMHVVLRVVLESGRVERMEVLLPNHGFSRWFELENRTVVLDEDPEARMAAIEWALQRLEPTLIEVAAGARAIDFIPEPIAPVGERAPIQSDEADTATSTDGSDAPAPTPAQSTGGGQTSPSGSALDPTLEQLMSGAVEPVGGGSSGETTGGFEQGPEETQTVVYPLGLRALQRGNSRIVIFAAGDGDLGDAYDGFFVERVRDGS
ncbi:MAG: hypothetical protein OHK0013_20930 [Sandaracinaceae bacterium]